MSERVVLTTEQAKAMLPDKEYVHTFRCAPNILIGAEWRKAELETEIDKCRCELAGPLASEMGHGLAIFTAEGHLFVETKPFTKTKQPNEP